jgi:hypothetical protein
MASSTNRDKHIVLASEVDRCHDIAHIRATRNHARTTLNHGIVNLAGFIVTFITRLYQLATQVRFKFFYG